MYTNAGYYALDLHIFKIPPLLYFKINPITYHPLQTYKNNELCIKNASFLYLLFFSLRSVWPNVFGFHFKQMPGN